MKINMNFRKKSLSRTPVISNFIMLISFQMFLSDYVGIFAQDNPAGTWLNRKALPTARQEIAHAVLEGKIYVPGGIDVLRNSSNLVEVFDPATNFWNTAAPMPIQLHHTGAAAVNGKLYILGGYVGSSFSATTSVYEYDPGANSWAAKQSMSQPRGAHAAVAFQEKIYVFGGIIGSRPSGSAEVFDPAENTWQSLAGMPTAREHVAAATIDSLIYVVGGRNGINNNNRLEAYSPASNRWFELSPMPTARSGLAAAAVRGRLYVFGGEIPGVFQEVEEYDPDIEKWQQVNPMPTPRHGIGAAVVADSIFIIGGADREGFAVSDVNEVFIPPSVSTSAPSSETELPGQFILYQNYPNPFNPVTRIQYSLARRQFVGLKVYNAMGQEVGRLVETNQKAGVHQVSFHAGALPSGIYLYGLYVGDELIEKKKMIILR